MQPVTIEELKKVIALNGLAYGHLQWILNHSESMEYKDGELVGKKGEPSDLVSRLKKTVNRTVLALFLCLSEVADYLIRSAGISRLF
jgi:hypothetical protein